MTRGPYQPDPITPATPAGVFGVRSWHTLACIQDRHDACTDRGRRCDCECHLLVTGAWIHGMEPA